MDLDHIRIPRNKHVFRGHNIQKANSFHTGLKCMVNSLFKGVSTKYLNNYVVYHAIMAFAHGTEDSREETVLGYVFTTKCVSLWKKKPARKAIPV